MGNNLHLTDIYLSIKEKSKKLKELERLAKQNHTQLFMETPFRNMSLLSDVLAHCNGELKLCIATDISLETEFIVTKTISEWKKDIPNLKNDLQCLY